MHPDTAVRALPLPSALAARAAARTLDAAEAELSAHPPEVRTLSYRDLRGEALAVRERWRGAQRAAWEASAVSTAAAAVCARCALDGSPGAGLAVLSALASLVAILRGAEAVAATMASLGPRGAAATPEGLASASRAHRRAARRYVSAVRIALECSCWGADSYADAGDLAAGAVRVATGLEPLALVQTVADASHPEDASTWVVLVLRLSDTIRGDLTAAGWEVPSRDRVAWPPALAPGEPRTSAPEGGTRA